MKLRLFLISLLSFVITSCSDESSSPSSIEGRQHSERDDGADLARASLKGHLLGVLMTAIQFNDEMSAQPAAQAKDTQGEDIQIRRAEFEGRKINLKTLPIALLQLQSKEQALLGTASKQFWAARSRLDSDYMPSNVLSQYDGLLQKDGLNTRLTSLGVPRTCRYLPTQFEKITSWKACIEPFRSHHREVLLGAGRFGASLAQALFFKERSPTELPVADVMQPTRIVDAGFGNLQRMVGDHLGEVVPEDLRKSFTGAWAEVSELPRGISVDTILESSSFHQIFETVSVEQLTNWVAGELNRMANIAKSAHQEPIVQSFARFDKQRAKLYFTLSTAVAFHKLTTTEGLQIDRLLENNRELEIQMERFSSALLASAVDYWNDLISRDDLIRKSLDEVQSSDLKRLLKARLSSAADLVDHPERIEEPPSPSHTGNSWFD